MPEPELVISHHNLVELEVGGIMVRRLNNTQVCRKQRRHHKMNNDIAVLGTQHSGQCSKYTVKFCRDEAIVSTPVRVIVLLSTAGEVGFFCHKRRGYLISLLFK